MLKTLILICMLSVFTGIKLHKDFYSHKTIQVESQIAISVDISPANPVIIKDQNGQNINFDILIKNTGTHIIELNTIKAAAMNASAKAVSNWIIINNGTTTGIKSLGSTVIKPGETIHIFNPFRMLPANVNVVFLKYQFFFDYADNDHQKKLNNQRLPTNFDLSFEKIITPRVYAPKSDLNLPLKDRFILTDSRALNTVSKFQVVLSAQQAKNMAANANPNACEIASIDEKGNMFKNDPFKKENWYSYGKPVYAPAGGMIAESQNTIPDNEFSGKTIISPKIPGDVDPFGMGNHVVIDHGNGEFSLLLGMEKGSVKVRAGDHIKAGQLLGNIGFSGNTLFPHLHYTLMKVPKEVVSQGIPPYFSNYKLFKGTDFVLIKKGHADSGDIIQSED